MIFDGQVFSGHAASTKLGRPLGAKNKKRPLTDTEKKRRYRRNKTDRAKREAARKAREEADRRLAERTGGSYAVHHLAVEDVTPELRQRAFDLWMSCRTQEQIADDIGYSSAAVRKLLDTFRTNDEPGFSAESDESEDTVSEICRKLADLPKSDKSLSEHATDFALPIYNIWKQQEKSGGNNHFGNSEMRRAPLRRTGRSARRQDAKAMPPTPSQRHSLPPATAQRRGSRLPREPIH